MRVKKIGILVLFCLLGLSLSACNPLKKHIENINVTTDNKNTIYTITFETNGGSKIQEKKVSYDSKITSPVTPIKKGFQFIGWFVDPTLRNEFNFNVKIRASFTLYAKWAFAFDTMEKKVLFEFGNRVYKDDCLVFECFITNQTNETIYGLQNVEITLLVNDTVRGYSSFEEIKCGELKIDEKKKIELSFKLGSIDDKWWKADHDDFDIVCQAIYSVVSEPYE